MTAGTPLDQPDDLGAAVAIEGDYAIVGASSAGAEGRAYIYHRNRSTWSEETILAPSDPVLFGNFGSSVALSGDSVIVGSDQGAYVFHRTGSTWTEQAKLTGPSGPAGSQVSLSAQTAVTSASPNKVLVFQRTGTTWSQQAVLVANDAAALVFFANSVCVSGDHVIVAAGKLTNTDYSGAVYIFERSGSNWVQQAKLESIPPSTKNRFAESVALSGDYAVVGDTFDDDEAPGAGAAYIYRRTGSVWPVVEKVTASDGAMFDWFGSSAAIDGLFGGQAIVGAEGNDLGAAYVLSNFSSTFDTGMIDPSKYSIYAKILFGLVGGGGGVIWLPGTGPVPVDPEPFKAWSALSPRKRDVLVGLAISEAANLISDRKLRQQVQSAGLRLMKQAASRMRIPSATETI